MIECRVSRLLGECSAMLVTSHLSSIMWVLGIKLRPLTWQQIPLLSKPCTSSKSILFNHFQSLPKPCPPTNIYIISLL